MDQYTNTIPWTVRVGYKRGWHMEHWSTGYPEVPVNGVSRGTLVHDTSPDHHTTGSYGPVHKRDPMECVWWAILSYKRGWYLDYSCMGYPDKSEDGYDVEY